MNYDLLMYEERRGEEIISPPPVLGGEESVMNSETLIVDKHFSVDSVRNDQ